MQHNFDVDIATKYGIVEAVLLNNLAYWIAKNKANNQHLHDGRYWTYNSVRAYSELFPYLSEKQIRRALHNMIEDGLIVTGNYNEKAYDRKLWYALTDKAMADLGVDLNPPKGESTCPKRKMHLPKRENAIAQKGEPIADINTNINTDININSSSSSNVVPTIAEGRTTTTAAAKEAISFWIDNTGQYGEVIRSDISDLTDKYGAEFVKEAMREAIRSNVRKIKYVEAIAERMASGQERKAKEAPATGNAWNVAFEKLFGGEDNGSNPEGEHS